MPATPSAPATVEFTAMDTVAVSISPFTGQQQVQDWQASWLEASVSMPALTHAQAQEWIAFLMSLRGQAKVFQLGDSLAIAPRGSRLGTPLVDGAGQTGYLLATKGGQPMRSAYSFPATGFRSATESIELSQSPRRTAPESSS